ncbi:23S rRNA (cytidine1920-2'-O)/16S rRNA (cytidine1409-2'-O)-methyltransferase [Andreprevotia lacus DSM 23236]|jgi:23S rRNA (cytidine1920-2'-O)/16S rRNA (cytidine1409-2'-O)-methyltransferase|uniref:23S rRNA (Cytidine1920-2'-O)/16S rRNA (Cytidine1409-2'-O)-methyltransferase n=1 Tax=Andreprevotia lacus DSM 23236 TaxID=1121001 RepID=A0A1W1XT43_9NEIS|nr:TlyA family RNA methyltransferase [Andreprevotia lacus]SMC27022.1 23S rRNA (cytidine1920-2'-O)/16S rRNA (cytidine1409-2'-O)-methyltransferase [Andreprevotia lacus DSM 23236]
MQRIDLLLVEQGLAASRTAAQGLIDAGRVQVDGKPVSKSSSKFDVQAVISVTPDEADRFVSRGGLKLAGALAQSGLDVTGMQVIDVGQSTGGFSDCLLQAGARRVLGLEVGHSQLHPRLQGDARVVTLEGINARHVTPADLADQLDGPAGAIVGDVSFISLTLILPALASLLPSGGKLLFLVKPQFEVGPQGLGKGGIVRDASLYPQVEQKIRAATEAAGFAVLAYFDSPIAGGDGNREFFIYANRQ